MCSGIWSSPRIFKKCFRHKPELNKSGNLVVKAEKYREYKYNYGPVSNDREYKVNNIDLEFDYFTINGRIFDYVTLEPVKDAEITFVYE